jgi:hypothetical protein
MKWHYAAAVAAAVLTQTTAAFGEDPQPTPAAKLETIQKDVNDAQAAFYKAVQTLPQDAPESQKKAQELYTEFEKKQKDGFMAAVELAKTDPKSETAFAALEWVLTTPRAYYLPAGKAALEMANEHYSADPKIGKVVAWVGYYFPRGQGGAEDEAAALIRAVAAKNPDRTARGQATMGLADQAETKFAVAEYRKSPDTEALAVEAEKAFQAVIKDYGDCPRLIGKNAGTLGERAKQALFELQHLRVGKVAPEIEGEDLDGKNFKLTDYRGKVVMLDFWGNW